MDNSSAIKRVKYVENHEEFEFTTYNDITVIVHVESGFYNAGKICSDNKKRFSDLSRNQSYVGYIESINRLTQKSGSYDSFELNEGFTNKVRGTYVLCTPTSC
jgi:hypothetical protein